jgi:N-acetylglutamate synthase-like GNAT family acetyltransferase
MGHYLKIRRVDLAGEGVWFDCNMRPWQRQSIDDRRISGYSDHMPATYTIRSAVAADEATIKAIIRAEHLDPFNVHWQNFLVAVDADAERAATGERATDSERIIGIGQIKPFRSGRELGSLAVAADWRQNGVGGAIINALIAREDGPLLLFCLAFREPYYAKFGFRRCGRRELRGELKFKYVMGSIFSRLFRQRLIVMQRPASTA